MHLKKNILLKVIVFINLLKFIPKKYRYFLTKLAFNPDIQKKHSFIKKHELGFKYCGSLDSFIDWNIFFFGVYNKFEINLLREIGNTIKDPNIFLDIGSNSGLFSLSMSKIFTKIIGIEPFLPVFKQSLKNIKLNKLKNINFLNIAVGEKNERKDLYIPIGNNKGIARFKTKNNEALKQFKFIKNKILVMSLDRLIKKMKIKKIELIKVDVQGFEKQTIFGMKKTVKFLKPIIVFDMIQDKNKSKKERLKILQIFKHSHRIFGWSRKKKFLSSKFELSENIFYPNDSFLAIPNNKLYILESTGIKKFFIFKNILKK